jgi:transposase
VDRPADSLPDDIDALRALASTVIAERDRLIELNDRLRRLLRKAQGFEAKSERLAKLHPDQLNLALEDIEQTIAKAEAIEEKTQAVAVVRKRRINRGALPAICHAFTRRSRPPTPTAPAAGCRCT